jgi:hypothetical protein
MTARSHWRRHHPLRPVFLPSLPHPSRRPTRGPATASEWASTSSIPSPSPRSLPTSPQVHFIKNASDNAACPADADDCQDTAYLVPGDLMLVGKTRGAYSCGILQFADDGSTPFNQASVDAGDCLVRMQRIAEILVSYDLLSVNSIAWPVNSPNSMSHVLQNISLCFQWLSSAIGGSMQHDCDRLTKFEVRHDAAVWTVREIEDVKLAEIKMLHEDGMSVTKIA